MVVIRLARGGRVKQAVYRIVAADKRRAATGKFLAVLGTYNPHTKEVKLDQEALSTYLKNGAQPSDRVLRLLQTQKIDTPAWAKLHDRFKKPKNSEEAETKEAAAAETAAESSDTTDEAKQSVDAGETAASEEAVAEKQKEATEKVAKAAEKASDSK